MHRVQPEDVLQYSMCGRCTLSDTDCTMTTVLLVCRCHAWSGVICAGVQGQVSCGFSVNAYGKLNTLVLPNLALCLASAATSTCCACISDIHCGAVSWLQRSKTMGLQSARVLDSIQVTCVLAPRPDSSSCRSNIQLIMCYKLGTYSPIS